MSYEEVFRLMLGRGFLLPSSELYSDAPAGFWEYGPLGVLLKNRFLEIWRRKLVRRDNMLEIDGSQVMSKSVFVASGHLQNFEDPIVSCNKCKATHRADRLIQEKTGKIIPENMKTGDMNKIILQEEMKCPSCGGSLGSIDKFNMMFKLGIGPSNEEVYLRPETCQSIFVDFPRLFRVMRCKLPIAFAQFGKSFRNEIAPRQSLMRLREFYQAEIEVFFNPEKEEIQKYDEIKNETIRILINEDKTKEISIEDAIQREFIPNQIIGYYLAILQQFYRSLGINIERTRFRRLGDDEKAFYAKVAYDFEVKTSLGWVELVACNHRGDYDLRGHSRESKKELTVLDGEEKVLPNVFELSMGIDRSLYTLLEHTIRNTDGRTVIGFKPSIAPIQAGIFPLFNKDKLRKTAKDIEKKLKEKFEVFYDESGSIGRRYRRMDEIGTPISITIDYQTLEDDAVTVRDRDDMSQIRVNINQLENELIKRFS